MTQFKWTEVFCPSVQFNKHWWSMSATQQLLQEKAEILISTPRDLQSSGETATEAGNFQTVKSRYCHEKDMQEVL